MGVIGNWGENCHSMELSSQVWVNQIEVYYDKDSIMGVRVDFDDGTNKHMGT